MEDGAGPAAINYGPRWPSDPLPPQSAAAADGWRAKARLHYAPDGVLTVEYDDGLQAAHAQQPPPQHPWPDSVGPDGMMMPPPAAAGAGFPGHELELEPEQFAWAHDYDVGDGYEEQEVAEFGLPPPPIMMPPDMMLPGGAPCFDPPLPFPPPSSYTTHALHSLYCAVCDRAFSSGNAVLQHLRDSGAHRDTPEAHEAAYLLECQDGFCPNTDSPAQHAGAFPPPGAEQPFMPAPPFAPGDQGLFPPDGPPPPWAWQNPGPHPGMQAWGEPPHLHHHPDFAAAGPGAFGVPVSSSPSDVSCVDVVEFEDQPGALSHRLRMDALSHHMNSHHLQLDEPGHHHGNSHHPHIGEPGHLVQHHTQHAPGPFEFHPHAPHAMGAPFHQDHQHAGGEAPHFHLLPEQPAHHFHHAEGRDWRQEFHAAEATRAFEFVHGAAPDHGFDVDVPSNDWQCPPQQQQGGFDPRGWQPPYPPEQWQPGFETVDGAHPPAVAHGSAGMPRPGGGRQGPRPEHNSSGSRGRSRMPPPPPPQREQPQQPPPRPHHQQQPAGVGGAPQPSKAVPRRANPAAPPPANTQEYELAFPPLQVQAGAGNATPAGAPAAAAAASPAARRAGAGGKPSAQPAAGGGAGGDAVGNGGSKQAPARLRVGAPAWTPAS